MTFEEIGLSAPILEAVRKAGFINPTPVQEQVIPRLLQSPGDLIALAQTGTGKTAAFGLPILHMLALDKRTPQALILCPTRELCVQITRDLQSFAIMLPEVRITAVYGGASIQTQVRQLHMGTHIIVATPGRMADLLRRKAANLMQIQRVVLDEADEMLNMGFQEDLENILSQVAPDASKLLFSATMPQHVSRLADACMRNPESITIGKRNAGAETVTHRLYIVHQQDRYTALKRILDSEPSLYGIIFCRTRQDTQDVADGLLRDGFPVDAIHGELSQLQRDRVMQKFRDRRLQLLVATDVAARGLDVNDLTHVINYQLPDDPGSYTHRSGRTGRAGKDGVSILIINMREKNKARIIERMTGRPFDYQPVPSAREVCRDRLSRLCDKILSLEPDTKRIHALLPDLAERLASCSPTEIAERFLTHLCGDTIQASFEEPDVNVGPAHSAQKGTRSAAPHKPLSPSRVRPSLATKARSAGATPRTTTRPVHSPRPRHPATDPDRSTSRQAPPTPVHPRPAPPTPDRPAGKHPVRPLQRQAPGQVTRLFVNAGTAVGMDMGKLISFVGNAGQFPGKLNRIEIMRNCSLFEVPAHIAPTLTQNLSGANFQGRAVRVELADSARNARPPKKAARKGNIKRPRKT